MKKPLYIPLYLAISVVLLSSMFHAAAQEATPEPTAEVTPEAVIPEDRQLPRTYEQGDLTVFTGNVQRPNGMIWFKDVLYIACAGDFTLYQVDGDNGETVTLIAGVRNGHHLAAEITGEGYNLWMPDFDQNILFITNQDMQVVRRVANKGLDGPWGIVPLAEDFLVTNLKGDNIVQVNRQGDATEVVGGLRSPAGIVNADDYIYVVNYGSARRAIEWFAVDEIGAEVTMKPLVSGLQSASNLVMASDGYLYFTYALGTQGVVGRVDPEECRAEGCSTDQIEVVVNTELQAPLAGLVISPELELFVHTIYRPEIYKVRLYQ